MSAPVSFGGIGQAFQSRNFTIFWWGQLNLSIAAAAQMLPILLLCPIGGVTADRWGAQRQLIWACAATGWAGSYFGIQAPLTAAAIVGLALVALSRRHVRSEMANLETGRLTADLRQPAE